MLWYLCKDFKFIKKILSISEYRCLLKTGMSYPARFVEFFGPCTWKTMHAISFTYGTDPFHPTPDEEEAAVNFFNSLAHLLPCGACRTHYESYLKQNPVDTSSREALSKWVYDLHENVNKRNHKDGLSYDQVQNDYTGWNQEKILEFQALSMKSRLDRLADPHFNRSIQLPGGVEEANALDRPEKLFMMLGLGVVLSGFLYYLNKDEKEKKK